MAAAQISDATPQPSTLLGYSNVTDQTHKMASNLPAGLRTEERRIMRVFPVEPGNAATSPTSHPRNSWQSAAHRTAGKPAPAAARQHAERPSAPDRTRMSQL